MEKGSLIMKERGERGKEEWRKGAYHEGKRGERERGSFSLKKQSEERERGVEKGSSYLKERVPVILCHRKTWQNVFMKLLVEYGNM